jgi:hypothetical protein
MLNTAEQLKKISEENASKRLEKQSYEDKKRRDKAAKFWEEEIQPELNSCALSGYTAMTFNIPAHVYISLYSIKEIAGELGFDIDDKNVFSDYEFGTWINIYW